MSRTYSITDRSMYKTPIAVAIASALLSAYALPAIAAEDEKAVSDSQEASINLDATVKFGPVDEDGYVEVYATNITDERVINWKGQGANSGWMSNSYNPPSMYGIRFNLAY